mmetsp:Transcript_10536/g.18618  ORF Transcript_10536/g.18618 Transcript_10536/m.18618 type:complete len:100 (+) Transcript_10536:1152-1451(+)
MCVCVCVLAKGGGQAVAFKVTFSISLQSFGQVDSILQLMHGSNDRSGGQLSIQQDGKLAFFAWHVNENLEMIHVKTPFVVKRGSKVGGLQKNHGTDVII